MTTYIPFETPLNCWLGRATKQLCDEAAAQVRAEITDHYQSSLDAGATPEQALAALGDPKRANRQYRKILLTRHEAKVLHSKWTIWLYRALLAVYLVFAWFIASNPPSRVAAPGWSWAVLFLLMGLPYISVLFPFHSRSWRRTWLALKIACIPAGILLIQRAGIRNMTAGFLAAMYIAFLNSFAFHAIARKLPSNQWPRYMYW